LVSRSQLAAVLAAISLLVAVPASATATTVVTGTQDTSTALLIDPTVNPDDPETIDVNFSSMGRLAFIERMPVTKTISRVTLGDLASASSCSAPVSGTLFVHEHPDGNLANPQQISYSEYSEDLPSTPGKVSWTLPPTVLKKDKAYSFSVAWDNSTCPNGRLTTWGHNEATVDGGSVRCTRGAPAAPSGNLVEHRMWHAAGLADRDPGCVSYPTDWAFHYTMPEGWLVTDQSGSYVLSATGYSSEPPAADICGTRAAEAGAGPVYWRETPGYPGHADYVCMWPQYGPLDEQTDDGWYFGMPWRNDGIGAPRDVYLELDSIDYQQLLFDHVPELRYDDDELYYPMAASSITDFYIDNGQLDDSNALKAPGIADLAVSNPNLIPPLGSLEADQLNLDYLAPTYPPGGAGSAGGWPASDTDFLSERSSEDHGSYEDDARDLQQDPSGRYFGRIYGHVAADSQGRSWLQYFRFYYYNGQSVFGIGKHEGDWESVQVRLDFNLQPDLVSFEAHGGEETCQWADAVTSNGHPIAWIGADSHAAYSRPGQYRGGLDNAQGDGLWLLAPSIEVVTSTTPWMQWPGRWGDSGGNSPRSPLQQGDKWDDPEAWTQNVDDCDMGDPF
jgi:hypothetical protein